MDKIFKDSPELRIYCDKEIKEIKKHSSKFENEFEKAVMI